MAIVGQYLYKQTDNAINATTYVKFTFKTPVRSIIILSKAPLGGPYLIYSRDGTLENGEVDPQDHVEIHAVGAPPRMIVDISLKCSALPAPDFKIMTVEG